MAADRIPDDCWSRTYCIRRQCNARWKTYVRFRGSRYAEFVSNTVDTRFPDRHCRYNDQTPTRFFSDAWPKTKFQSSSGYKSLVVSAINAAASAGNLGYSTSDRTYVDLICRTPHEGWTRRALAGMTSRESGFICFVEQPKYRPRNSVLKSTIFACRSSNEPRGKT